MLEHGVLPRPAVAASSLAATAALVPGCSRLERYPARVRVRIGGMDDARRIRGSGPTGAGYDQGLRRSPTRAPTERPGASRPEPVDPVIVRASPSSSTPDSGSGRQPARSSLQVHELAPGQVAGVGQIIATSGSAAPAGRGL